MPSVAKLERWNRYEAEIDEFVAMKQMSDEVLFQAIQSCSQLLLAYANNVKDFAQEGNLKAVESTLLEISKCTNILKNDLREAKERARQNG